MMRGILSTITMYFQDRGLDLSGVEVGQESGDHAFTR